MAFEVGFTSSGKCKPGCAAYVEKQLKLGERTVRTVLVPCLGHKTHQQKNRRFCDMHERAYKELMYGILLERRMEVKYEHSKRYKKKGEN